MKLKRSITCFILCGFGLINTLIAQNTPKSNDLRETDVNQRRDLSIPMSRIVLNFFDFHSTLNAYQYSNRPTMPLNIAYLSTEKNVSGTKSITRFSRSVTDLVTMHKTKAGINGVMKDSTLGSAVSYSTEWTPSCLPFKATYGDNSTIEGFDFFYDENTIIRKLTFRENSRNFILSGNYGGNIKFENNKVIIDNGNLKYAITFSYSINDFVTFNNKWYVKFDDDNLQGNTLIISVAFVDKSEDLKSLSERVETPIQQNNIDQIALDREAFWDDFLKKVPHPLSFQLTYVDPKGTTSHDLKMAYYKAWVFTVQNVLPGDNTIYPYPQICTGKPSLWDEGERRAPFSAAWESFMGIQFYSYIDPDLSWNAFKGLMSLVDENGMLGGESLPSRKAQTAMILYTQKEDKQALEEVYPALKRYLNWRMKITHWVYGELKPTESLKDADFAFPALVDMEYMMKIAAILGKNEDIIEWREKHDEFSKKCLEWFWETPITEPVQYYNTETKERKQRNPVWVTTGLYVNGLLSGDYKKSMLELFDKEYNPALGFSGFNEPKYPDISYTTYGLLNYGLNKRAFGLIEANLRDIIKTHTVFAEDYIAENYQPMGVRPSLFGSSTIIDFVWLLNGYKYDRGEPTLVLLGHESRGLTNIHIQGEIYELKIDEAEGARKVYWGKYNKLKEISAKNLINLKLQ